MEKSMVRRTALGLTIAFDVAMLVFWALARHWGFFWCFMAINAVVIVFEVLNNLLWYGKTLSTEAKHRIEHGRARRTYVYLAISFMVAAMAALAVHLGWV